MNELIKGVVYINEIVLEKNVLLSSDTLYPVYLISSKKLYFRGKMTSNANLKLKNFPLSA